MATLGHNELGNLLHTCYMYELMIYICIYIYITSLIWAHVKYHPVIWNFLRRKKHTLSQKLRLRKCLIQHEYKTYEKSWCVETDTKIKWLTNAISIGLSIENRIYVSRLLLRPLTADIEATRKWWRHQMETFSVLLAICAGNSPVTGRQAIDTLRSI